MALVRVHNFAISLDGFGTGEGRDEHLVPGRGNQPCAELLRSALELVGGGGAAEDPAVSLGGLALVLGTGTRSRGALMVAQDVIAMAGGVPGLVGSSDGDVRGAAADLGFQTGDRARRDDARQQAPALELQHAAAHEGMRRQRVGCGFAAIDRQHPSHCP